MADYNEQFGYTPNPACLDQDLNEVGTQDNHAFSFEATDSIEPSCDERKNGFGCLTTNFIKKFNWLANAWEKAIHTLGLTDADLQDQINNISSVTIGLDNQIPYVNGTNDDFEYDTVLFYDHTQTELNTEQITTNLGVISSEEFGSGANTNGFIDSVAVGYLSNITGIRSVAIGSKASATSSCVTVGEFSTTDNQSVAVGGRTEALTFGVAVGGSSEAGPQGVAIGWSASTIDSYCIAIGRDSVAGVLSSREFVAHNVTHSYFGLNGVERSALVPNIGDFYLRTTGANSSGATDQGGDNLHIQAGSSTGSGDGGKLFFGTSQPGATGTIRRDQVDMWSVNPDGNFESLINGAGIVLKSPDGLTTRTLTIDNTGALIVA